MDALQGSMRDRYKKALAVEMIAKGDMVLYDTEMNTVRRMDVTYQPEKPVLSTKEIEGKLVAAIDKSLKEKMPGLPEVPDMVNKPPHYTKHKSGVECIQITEHMNFCLGNALKYIWRAEEKGATLEDLKKARWYLDREISRRETAK